jgi:hypothetical protein
MIEDAIREIAEYMRDDGYGGRASNVLDALRRPAEPAKPREPSRVGISKAIDETWFAMREGGDVFRRDGQWVQPHAQPEEYWKCKDCLERALAKPDPTANGGESWQKLYSELRACREKLAKWDGYSEVNTVSENLYVLIDLCAHRLKRAKEAEQRIKELEAEANESIGNLQAAQKRVKALEAAYDKLKQCYDDIEQDRQRQSMLIGDLEREVDARKAKLAALEQSHLPRRQFEAYKERVKQLWQKGAGCINSLDRAWSELIDPKPEGQFPEKFASDVAAIMHPTPTPEKELTTCAACGKPITLDPLPPGPVTCCSLECGAKLSTREG